MPIQVLFFGATAAVTGKRRVQIETDERTIADSVFESILNEHPSLRGHKLRFSVNQQFATGEEVVCDGDELAIFTAVSGG